MTDTAQQKLALRVNSVARAIRREWPQGQRVEGAPGHFGTVERHVPQLNALGGYLVVRWDNGETGRHSPIGLHKTKGSGKPLLPLAAQQQTDRVKRAALAQTIEEVAGPDTRRNPMQAKTTPAVRIAIPNRRGRTHIVAHKEEGGWARTACNHSIQVSSNPWDGEPPYRTAVTSPGGWSVGDVDCQRCAASTGQEG